MKLKKMQNVKSVKGKVFKVVLNILMLVVFSSVISACSSDVNRDEQGADQEVTTVLLKERIQEIDDSLKVLFEKKMEDDNFQIDRLVYHEGINRCIEFYRTFPENDYAPYAIEKAAGMYDALRITQKAVEWRDTLIANYPNYDRMLFVLEQQKVNYDSFEVYEPEKIKFYIEKMLQLETLTADKREELEFRLDNINLNFMDLARLRNPDLDI
jgi:hypothetical protein